MFAQQPLPSADARGTARESDFANIDGIMTSAILQGDIPGGVVLIGHNGKVVYRKAFGSRAVEPVREAMTVDTIFDFASLTKCIATTTSVMKLVQEGKIRLNAPVATYLPEFAKNGKDNITIRELLTHFSGLREDLDLKTPWEGYVITDRDHMQSYLCDRTVVCVRPKPAEKVVVVKPGNAREISEILKLANLDKTPVFIRGGGTGLCGGAIPTRDGLLISMERLNKVIELDADNLMITVEAGVTLADILKAADGAGLFFPPHPGDKGAQAGGMVALNAGGTRAVKYGVPAATSKDWKPCYPPAKSSISVVN